jgi:hypothetical protein
VTNHGDRRRISSFGSFELPLTPEEAFGLFTAEGERDWVPGWEPEILGPLPQRPGLVFLTNMHGVQTIWTVLESDPARLTHRYSRVTPGHSAGIVEVELFRTEFGCRVGVSYQMTGLSPDAQPYLAGHSGKEYLDMLEQWRELIMAALRSDQLLPA